GAHLTGVDAFQGALATLKPARIAGCGGVTTRHHAMVAAESGADYGMFGEPGGRRPPPPGEGGGGRGAGGGGGFEGPCVGYAGAMDEVAPLAAAGAEFVALGDWIFAHERGPATAVAEAVRQLAPAEIPG